MGKALEIKCTHLSRIQVVLFEVATLRCVARPAGLSSVHLGCRQAREATLLDYLGVVLGEVFRSYFVSIIV